MAAGRSAVVDKVAGWGIYVVGFIPAVSSFWLGATGGLGADPVRAFEQTLGLWARYRWPTGWEAFGRPVRWVLDGSFTSYLGDQERVLGFGWAAKLGGGIEIDVGRHEFGAMGLSVSRIRLVARYFIGDNNVTGTSVGIGISF